MLTCSGSVNAASSGNVTECILLAVMGPESSVILVHAGTMTMLNTTIQCVLQNDS